jgi:hypothetical protein
MKMGYGKGEMDVYFFVPRFLVLPIFIPRLDTSTQFALRTSVLCLLIQHFLDKLGPAMATVAAVADSTAQHSIATLKNRIAY